jgi:hypothetical protein
MQLLINGVDYTQYCEQSSYYITQNFSRQGDTATFYLVDEHPGDPTNGIPVSLNVAIPALSTIELIDVGLGQTIFGGLTTMPQLKYQGPNLSTWQLDCVDWTYLSDRAIVVGDFQNLRVDQIIASLVGQAACGVNLGSIQMGPSLPRVKIIYETLSTALKKLANTASTSSHFGWWIDENQNLQFYDQFHAPASGVTFSDALSDLATLAPDGSGNLNLGTYDWTTWWYFFDGTAVLNQATVRGGTYANTQTDTFVGNGAQTTWPLTYTPDSTVTTKALSLTVGGVAQTISVQQGSSASTQWVIAQNAVGAWFLVASQGTAAPASGAVINLTYTYDAPVVARVEDSASISRYASLPNRGVFGVYIADSSLNNIGAAQIRGLQEVNTFSEPQERVQFTTNESWLGHVRAGQSVRVKNQVTPDSLRSMAPGINDSFLITQARINGKVGGYRTYYLTAVRISTPL